MSRRAVRADDEKEDAAVKRGKPIPIRSTLLSELLQSLDRDCEEERLLRLVLYISNNVEIKRQGMLERKGKGCEITDFRGFYCRWARGSYFWVIPSPVVGICMQARKMRSMAWRLRAPGYCHHMYSMVCSWLEAGSA